MALAQKGLAAAAGRMPKLLSPRSHALADFVMAGVFGLMAVAFWKRNRRAAFAALAFATAETATSLMTDYPGGILPVIDFPTHGKVDTALAAATFAFPNLLDFEDDPEAKYFRFLGLNLTVITGLTDFENRRERRPLLGRAA
jgi:hypothetical protein